MHSCRDSYVKDGPLACDVFVGWQRKMRTRVEASCFPCSTCARPTGCSACSVLWFAMCALYQNWPARSEDRSEVDSGTWQPRAADKTNSCWDWERMGGV